MEIVMMKPYNMSMTTRTYFGNRCVEDAIKKERDAIGRKTLLITTGNTLEKLGFVDELISWLEAEVVFYNNVTADPDVADIREAIALGKKYNVSSVIGFGGGSAMDAAKSAAVGIVSDIDIEDYLTKNLTPPNDTLPVIAIPTTAGTGAELSKGAIISSRVKRIKSGIRGEKVAPAVAIVDPVYTYGLPLNITMETGFDVFTHAAESYCAVKSNPFSEMLSEKAVRIVGEALPRLKDNLDDHEAREMMSFASHIMGFNVKNIGNCLPHRLQYPVGVATETSHGAGLIALYPAWLKHEEEVNPGRVRQILAWLGAHEGYDAGDKILNWLKKLGINRTITDLGNALCAEELAEMVTGNLHNDKLADVEGIIVALYKESM